MGLKRSFVTIAVKDKDGKTRFVKTRAKRVKISRKGWVTTIEYENGVVHKIHLRNFIETLGDRTRAIYEYALMARVLSGVEGIGKRLIEKLLP